MQHRSDKIGVLYIHFNRFLIKNVVFSLENICALCFFFVPLHQENQSRFSFISRLD